MSAYSDMYKNPQQQNKNAKDNIKPQNDFGTKDQKKSETKR